MLLPYQTAYTRGKNCRIVVNCKFSGIFPDIADKRRCDHRTNINRECHSCHRQKLWNDGSDTNRNDQLKYRWRIHTGMTFMLFLFFNQKTVIFLSESGLHSALYRTPLLLYLFSFPEGRPQIYLSKNKQKNTSDIFIIWGLIEVPPGFEPGIEVLQTFALPLGYGTILTFIHVRNLT